ncbi:type II secretion system F family protein [bacterium]|nr:type II secretion system F family protein [bacterium]
MATFAYRALKSDGGVAEGVIDAGARPDAVRQIESRGLTPISVKEKSGNGNGPTTAAQSAPPATYKVPFRALENFTRQLASLLAAGVPLARAMQVLQREASLPAAREQWKAIYDRVVDGESLADAMARFPKTFPRVYTAMVQAGETGGFLEVVLGQIADFQTREKELKGRVRSALIYPAVLLLLAIGVVIYLLTFFIPRFQKIFTGLGGQLPLLTQFIMKASEFLKTYGIPTAILIGVGIFMLKQWLSTTEGRREWERFVLKLPVFGPLSSRFAMTRFCRMLGTLVGAGVPLIAALRVARESIGNQTLIDAVTESIERVKKGDSLSASLADSKDLFPGSVIEMIGVAEESGKLDAELVRIAAVTDAELDQRLRMAVALAEPALLFTMAAFIGTIFIGMLLPIFSIQDYIK